jgi:hypothetical protein
MRMVFKRRELPLWQQLQDKCIHFNGMINKVCRAGVSYDSVQDRSQIPNAYPCLKGEWLSGEARPEATTTCEQQQFLTDEEAQTKADEIYARARARMERESAGFCGSCDQKVEKKVQVGPCIYNDPCGCRVGQGTLGRGRR